MQVDQRRVLRRAARALVEALAVERERRLATGACGVDVGEPARRLNQVRLGDSAQARDVLGREVANARLQRVEAARVRGDEADVEPAFPQHHVQHAVQERDVAAGLDLQVQVGGGGGLGAARIDDDDLQRRVGLARVLDAAKQDRVRERGVRSGDEERRRVREVVVAARRRVGAERRLVAGNRARHAQARVGVDVVGADQALGKLVEDVVVLGQELARDVESDRVGAVRGDRRGEAFGGEVKRRVPADRLRRRAARGTQLRLQQPGLHRHRVRRRQVQRAALAAQAPEVGRVIGVAANAGDRPGGGLDDHAAADAAIRAGGPRVGHVRPRLSLARRPTRRQRRCRRCVSRCRGRRRSTDASAPRGRERPRRPRRGR